MPVNPVEWLMALVIGSCLLCQTTVGVAEVRKHTEMGSNVTVNFPSFLSVSLQPNDDPESIDGLCV